MEMMEAMMEADADEMEAEEIIDAMVREGSIKEIVFTAKATSLKSEKMMKFSHM